MYSGYIRYVYTCVLSVYDSILIKFTKIFCRFQNNIYLCKSKCIYTYNCQNVTKETKYNAMRERILQIMNQERLSSSRFAEEIGIQRAAMSHISSGRNNPSLEIAKKILERFSYINPDWLLFGNGNMKRDGRPANPVIQQDLFGNLPYIQPEKKNIPEYRQEIRDKKPISTPKKTEIEEVIVKETPIKKVMKIMIFYSDNTYETFNPEK